MAGLLTGDPHLGRPLLEKWKLANPLCGGVEMLLQTLQVVAGMGMWKWMWMWMPDLGKAGKQ